MSKYGNIPTERDGIMFASRKQAARYQELLLLQRAGEIFGLECEPKFVLQPAFTDCDGKRVQAITYRPDFGYLVTDDSATFGLRHVVEEVKGMDTKKRRGKKRGSGTMTQASALRIKLFKFKYPEIKFVLVKD